MSMIISMFQQILSFDIHMSVLREAFVVSWVEMSLLHLKRLWLIG